MADSSLAPSAIPGGQTYHPVSDCMFKRRLECVNNIFACYDARGRYPKKCGSTTLFCANYQMNNRAYKFLFRSFCKERTGTISLERVRFKLNHKRASHFLF